MQRILRRCPLAQLEAARAGQAPALQGPTQLFDQEQTRRLIYILRELVGAADVKGA